MDAFTKLQSNPNQKIDGKDFSKPTWVSRNKPADLVGEPFERVFGVKENNLPKVVTSNLPGVGFAIYKINQVRAGELVNPNVLLQQQQQIAILSGQAELNILYGKHKRKSNC
jgi:hypothetical protein